MPALGELALAGSAMCKPMSIETSARVWLLPIIQIIAISSKSSCIFFLSIFILFYYESKLIGVTKVSVWANSVYAEFFWWNYDMPQLMLGKISSELEIELAKSTGNRYLYTGLGYHSHGVYKSLKKGFEWWTGRKWSTDTDKYKYLCKKDDEIKTIEELHQHQLNYFKEHNELSES